MSRLVIHTVCTIQRNSASMSTNSSVLSTVLESAQETKIRISSIALFFLKVCCASSGEYTSGRSEVIVLKDCHLKCSNFF